MPKKNKKKKKSIAANIIESITEYTTGTGQKLWNIHPSDKCAGEYCVIHNPSNHSMRDFPTHWRSDRGLMERICPHGVGHPDPDGLAYALSLDHSAGLHGCDGCCSRTLPIPCFNCGENHDCAWCDPSSYDEDDFVEVHDYWNDPEWVDQNAAPNGIGPICKYCHRLIDWSPTDHAIDCSRFGNNNGLGQEMMNRDNIIWLAGLFEGEGYVLFPGKNEVNIGIKMNDQDVIEKIHQIFGGSIYHYDREDPRHSDYWVWSLRKREEVKIIIERILPWMGERRTTKMIEGLERLGRQGQLSLIQHGTVSGYNKEIKRGLPTCKQCRKAVSESKQSRIKTTKLA